MLSTQNSCYRINIRNLARQRFATAALVCALAACYDSTPLEIEEPEPPPAPGSVRARLQTLTLDSLPGPVPTFYSPGARARAEALQEWLRTADTFFQARVGIRPRFRLAVLNEADWSVVSQGPYGIPFAGDTGKVVVLPAVPEKSVVTQIYKAAQQGLPQHAADDLARIGVSYDSAVARIVDLIGFHEVGHVYIAAMGYHVGTTARWLEELLATYAAYSFLQRADPSAMVMWNALSEAILGFVQPGTRSLDDFNRLYARVGPATYGWFQSHFNLRDAVLVEQRPEATWFAQLRAANLGDTNGFVTSDLLRRLDGVVPGFTQWADSAGLQYQ